MATVRSSGPLALKASRAIPEDFARLFDAARIVALSSANPHAQSSGRPHTEITLEEDAITRFVIGPGVALHLAQLETVVPTVNRFMAARRVPALVRP